MAEIFGVDIVASSAEESHAATPRAKAPTSAAAAHVKGNLGQAGWMVCHLPEGSRGVLHRFLYVLYRCLQVLYRFYRFHVGFDRLCTCFI